MQLSGKTVLITGAARRIGRDIALTLARRGASIIIHFRNSRREAVLLQREIEKTRSQAALIQADFNVPPKQFQKVLKKFLQQLHQKTKRVDVLVNNASIFYPTPLEKITPDDWEDFMAANLKAPFFLSQALGLAMKKQGSGKIINLVDWTGDRPMPQFLPYCISKAGLIAATKGLAKALAPQVQVIGIAPGPILPADFANAKQRRGAAERTLLKHYGSPKDIAQAVRFVIEDTDFMTGSVLSIEGGAALV